MLLATPSLSWVPIVLPDVPRSYLRARVLLLHRNLRTFDRTSLPHSHLRHLCMPTHFLFVVLASSFYIILSFFVAPSCLLPRRCSGLSALSPSLPHHCATCSDLRIPISHICTLFLPLSGISEYFSGLVYAFLYELGCIRKTGCLSHYPSLILPCYSRSYQFFL